jgi:hypothetical protein
MFIAVAYPYLLFRVTLDSTRRPLMNGGGRRRKKVAIFAVWRQSSMSLRVLISLLLLIAVVPVFVALALAWRELKFPSAQLKSPSTQPRSAGERSRDDPRRRFAPIHGVRNVN